MTDLTYDQQLHLTLLDHTAAIVKATCSTPQTISYVEQLTKAVYGALRDAAGPVVVPVPEPEIDKPTKREIADAVQPDSILCFEDGKRYKSLKRTVGKFGLTPADYREKWGLPADFPMVSPNYSATRSALAREHGLGKKL